ncbi:MAG: glycerophosphodiester phosphodiesterase family protein [Gemmatimonadota bacterium]
MTSPVVTRPAIIGHRGAAAESPENSMPALELAVRLGADALELDVQQSVDGAIVVIHDPTLQRTADAEGVIAEMAWSDLRDVRLRPKPGADPGPPLSRLNDVFERFPDVEITVDVKASRAAADVVALIQRFERTERTILYIEDGTGLPEFRAYRGRRATSTWQALRLALDRGWPARSAEREVPEVVHTPLSRWGIPIITPAFVRRMHEHHRSVQVWTVDEQDTMSRMADWGVDGIITNDVRVAVSLLKDGTHE